MQHQIPIAQSGPNGVEMAAAVSTCIRCGFCLPACPTYAVTGNESDSPRGRILLIKEVLEGGLSVADAAEHLDSCLGCLACEPACPSGVSYRDLLSPYRASAIESSSPANRAWGQRARSFLTRHTVPYPNRFRWAARSGQFAKWLGPLVPAALRPMLELLPDRLPSAAPLRTVYPAIGPRRYRVALLAGCAQRVLAPEINLASIDLLTHAGVEVLVPAGQGCCGALSWHVGDRPAATKFAAANLAAFDRERIGDVDAVLTTAAGCGSGMHEYPAILRGTAHEPAAVSLAGSVVDVSVFLDKVAERLQFVAPENVRRVAMHDACHLANAQGVREPPRRLLARVPGIEIVDVGQSQWCCGSAGTYNIEQPAMAAELGRRKAAVVLATGADVVVSGNIGCLTQLQKHIESPVRICHTMRFLRECLAK